AAGEGPVPSVAEEIAGARIKGSWWAHRQGKAIFRALSEIGDSPDIAAFKLIDGKVTFVHRRLWPALVAAASLLGKTRLARVEQVHTSSGAHRNVITAF